jgi:hypothetical protein
MVGMLERAGVDCDFLWVAGETRTNIVIIQEGSGRQGTVTVPSLAATHDDGERLLERVHALLPGRSWLVLGGHDIGDGGRQTTRGDTLRAFCEYARDPKNGVWVDTVANIGRYVVEHRSVPDRGQAGSGIAAR